MAGFSLSSRRLVEKFRNVFFFFFFFYSKKQTNAVFPPSLSPTFLLPTLPLLPVARDQLVHRPVLVAPVRQEPADDERYFFLAKLLGGDLQGVGLAGQLDHHGGVHAVFLLLIVLKFYVRMIGSQKK